MHCAVTVRCDHKRSCHSTNLSLCSCRSPQQRTQDLWVIFNNVNITVTFSYTSLLILSRKQHLQRCTLLQTEETLELYNGQNNCGTNNNNIIKSNRIFYYALMIKMYQQRDLTLWSAKFKRKVAAWSLNMQWLQQTSLTIFVVDCPLKQLSQSVILTQLQYAN